MGDEGPPGCGQATLGYLSGQTTHRVRVASPTGNLAGACLIMICKLQITFGTLPSQSLLYIYIYIYLYTFVTQLITSYNLPMTFEMTVPSKNTSSLLRLNTNLTFTSPFDFFDSAMLPAIMGSGRDQRSWTLQFGFLETSLSRIYELEFWATQTLDNI